MRIEDELREFIASLDHKPTIPEVLPYIRWFARLPENSVGGSLHIVLDDPNFSDGSVKYCAEYAKERGDLLGEQIALLLLKMSITQRKKLNRMFYDLQK